MVFVAVVIPPPQLKVAPLVVDEAVMVWVVFVQVRTTGGAIEALGGVTVWVTVTDEELVQPLLGSVTVTV